MCVCLFVCPLKSVQDGNTSDGVNFDWDTEDELEIASIPLSCSAVPVPGGVSGFGSGEVRDFQVIITFHNWFEHCT